MDKVARLVGRVGKKTAKSGRKDIQGLRAFAVLAVILDHLLGWPSGGFIGVDVFFVISGFLITGLLLREHERTGRISFSGFYRRRIKRILPASILVLLATVGASFAIFGQARFMSTLWDGVAAFFFSANWRFAAAGTDYFQASGPTSPLQHFWSLAVEEQFYFVWPWLMLAIFAVFARRQGTGSAARMAVGITMGAISVLSFAWAMWETANIPTQAYFSTFSRAWELGIGAALAVAAPMLLRIPAAIRPALAWVGLAGMVASLFVISEGAGFPAPAAALPVFSTAMVIAAGSGIREQKYLFPLTNRASQYVGDISYSLYLWHFPVIILLGAVWDLTSPLYLTLILAIVVVLSVYSYHLVEDPIRKSAWLDQKKSHKPRRDGYVSDKYKYTALSFLAVVTIVVCAAAVMKPHAAQPVAATPVKVVTTETKAAAPPVGPETGKLQAQIKQALAATAWPENLSPTMDEAIASHQAADDVTPCGKTEPVDDAACTWGDPNATKTAMIVGDSISMTYVAALRTALGDSSGWNVKSYGTFGCPFTDVTTENSDAAAVEACPARKAAAVDAINTLKPDVVFIANGYGPRTPVGASEPMTLDQWSARTEKLVSKFKAAAGKVVFLAAPPSEKNITKCYTKLSSPIDCVSSVTPAWADKADTEAALAKKIGATFIDSKQWFCVDGQCPSFVGTTPTKLDEVHMTQQYAAKIAPAIMESLKAQKVV